MEEDEFIGTCGMFWGKGYAYVTFFGKSERLPARPRVNGETL
jgi:hypothetical protein